MWRNDKTLQHAYSVLHFHHLQCRNRPANKCALLTQQEGNGNGCTVQILLNPIYLPNFQAATRYIKANTNIKKV